jgi:chorismate mutase
MPELMEKMLQLLIERGRFSDAIEIAKKARTISIEFSQKIRELILRVRKAPSSVKWKEDIQPRLWDARIHVQNRQKEDARMGSSVQSSLETANEFSVRQSLSTLRKMLTDSHKLRGKLLNEIMIAPDQFLDAQRSLFKVKVNSDIPDLENLLLPEVMKLPMAELAPLAEPIMSSFLSTNVHHLFDLNTAVQILMEKRDIAVEIEVDDGDISTIVELHNIFSPEEIQTARSWLAEKLQIISNSSSEALLRSAQNEGLPNPVCQCIAILLYQFFSSDDTLRIFDFQASERHFRLQFASGTVLTITRRKEIHYE